MLNESHKPILRNYGTLLARILMGLMFLSSGLTILFINGTAGTAAYYTSLGIPAAAALVWVVLLIKLGAGGALMLGYKTELAASALIGFTLIATGVAHMDVNDAGLWKNLAVIGGLLYTMAYGAGEGWSLDNQKSRSAGAAMNRNQQAAL